jgi:hypothetical protein
MSPHTLRRILSVLASTCAAAAQGAQGQTATITVGVNRPVSVDDAASPQIEPHLAVHPGDPRRLVAAAAVWRDGRMRTDAFSSADGGRSWRRTSIDDCNLDPWVAFAEDGTAFLSCLAPRDGPTAALVYRSADGGGTWTGPAELPLGGGSSFDHTSLVLRPSEHGQPPEVVVVGMQGVEDDEHGFTADPFFSRSANGGVTFDDPTRLVWSNVWSNPLNAVLLPDGTILLAFVDFTVDGRTPLERRRIWSARLAPDATAFSRLSLVAETDRMSTLPIITAGRDAGAPVVVAFDDVRDGRSGVFVVKSDDGGRRWRPATAVTDAAGSGKIHHAPVAAVGPGGSVVVAWYQQAPDRDDRCWRMHVAASSDEGETFSEPHALSSESFCADAPGSRVQRPDGTTWDLARRWPYGGDYFGLVPLGRGVFRAVWPDSRTGAFRLWSAEIRVTTQ